MGGGPAVTGQGLRWPAVGLAICVAACSGDSKKPEELNLAPVEYKAEIVLLLSKSLEEPTNIRDTFITEPVRANGGSGPYFVCVRYNARDANGNYKGSEDRAGYFYGGHLNQLVTAPPELCAKAPYKPFPELQKTCVAAKCP
jgi:hypothetical protein